jgi:hypothetical protein
LGELHRFDSCYGIFCNFFFFAFSKRPTKSLTSTKDYYILPIFSPPRSILAAVAAGQLLFPPFTSHHSLAILFQSDLILYDLASYYHNYFNLNKYILNYHNQFNLIRVCIQKSDTNCTSNSWLCVIYLLANIIYWCIDVFLYFRNEVNLEVIFKIFCLWKSTNYGIFYIIM